MKEIQSTRCTTREEDIPRWKWRQTTVAGNGAAAEHRECVPAMYVRCRYIYEPDRPSLDADIVFHDPRADLDALLVTDFAGQPEMDADEHA